MRFILLALLVFATSAAAHETSEERLRVIIVSEQDGATTIHIRQPAPLLFAREAAARASPSAAVEVQFLSGHAAGPAHHLDQAAIEQSSTEFATRIGETLSVALDGRNVTATVSSFTVQHVAALPPFRTPAEAGAAKLRQALETDPHIADAYIDAELTVREVGDIVLDFPLDPIAFPGHVHLENVFVDARSEAPETRVRTGALLEPVVMARP